MLLAIALIAAKALGYISMGWLAVIAIAAVLFILPSIISGNFFGTLFKDKNSNTEDPLLTDACGCGPTQSISLSRRNIWGNWKDAGIAPCNVALSRVSSRRWRINGCVN